MTLQWRKPDEHHIVTACGTFSVARVTVMACVHYVAWRRVPELAELDSVCLPQTATDAERIAAIKRMQERCAEDLLCGIDDSSRHA